MHFFIFTVKLNGGRLVTGVLRGYDPFMNLVLDETIEEVSASEKHVIGMVVSGYDGTDEDSYNDDDDASGDGDDINDDNSHNYGDSYGNDIYN